MRAINVLLSIAVSAFLAFLVLEGGLRLVGFSPPKSINEFHDKLGWTKRPGASVKRKTDEFKVTFAINAHGLRDDEDLQPAKKPNTFRVMMLGDSFVLGYTVDRADLFVDQLEGWWSSEERRIEVINAGTEGYSTDQEALWFREYGREYRPDVVVLFPYLNDIYWNGEERYTRFPKPRFDADGTLATGQLLDPGKMPLRQRLAIGRFLMFLKAPKHPGGPSAFQPAGAKFPVQREFAPLLKEKPPWLADAYARTKGALIALKNDCESVGARLVLCPIPPETAVHPDEREKFGREHLGGIPLDAWDPMEPVNAFVGLGKELEIETLNPSDVLKTLASKGERLYYDAEWHFNPAGNRALATYLHEKFDSAAELRGGAILPEAHQAIAQGAIPERAHAGGIKARYKVFGVLWIALTSLYMGFYRDEPRWQPPLKCFAMLAFVFTILFGGRFLLGKLPPNLSLWLGVAFVAGILGFVAWKLGRRLGTILELLKAFTLRGHWYLMPLVVVLLSIGSLLVVAASSPLVAPFIYTLF